MSESPEKGSVTIQKVKENAHAPKSSVEGEMANMEVDGVAGTFELTPGMPAYLDASIP